MFCSFFWYQKMSLETLGSSNNGGSVNSYSDGYGFINIAPGEDKSHSIKNKLSNNDSLEIISKMDKIENVVKAWMAKSLIKSENLEDNTQNNRSELITKSLPAWVANLEMENIEQRTSLDPDLNHIKAPVLIQKNSIYINKVNSVQLSIEKKTQNINFPNNTKNTNAVTDSDKLKPFSKRQEQKSIRGQHSYNVMKLPVIFTGPYKLPDYFHEYDSNSKNTTPIPQHGKSSLKSDNKNSSKKILVENVST